MPNTNYRIIDLNTYYRKGVFEHFSKGAKCSLSLTHRIEVTKLKAWSEETGSSFYLNFLYVLSRALNAREDYRMAWLYKSNQLVCYEVIHPTQYVFHEDTETFTLAYTEYDEDYRRFYANALRDLEDAKQTREYRLDMEAHPNWFDASCIPWISYDSLHIELPDGYLFFNPIVNWGRYENENGALKMPVTVRLNHAAADGFAAARVFTLIEEEIERLVR